MYPSYIVLESTRTRPCLWLCYRRSSRSHAGRVRSRWISLAIRQIDRKGSREDHHALTDCTLTFPISHHHRFETPSGKAASRTRAPVVNHSVGQVEVGSRNINNRRFFRAVSHTRQSKSRKFRQLIECALHDDEVYASYAASRKSVSWRHISVSKWSSIFFLSLYFLSFRDIDLLN